MENSFGGSWRWRELDKDLLKDWRKLLWLDRIGFGDVNYYGLLTMYM